MAISDGASTSKTPTTIKKLGFIDRLANWLATDPVENAGFRITWKLAARTREFKMKVYPAFAYVPVYFVYVVMNGSGNNYGQPDLSIADRYADLQAGRSYIFLIYLCTFLLSFILQNVSNSPKYKAAWVYYALPIDKPGKILAGMYKAIITLYFVPYYLVLCVVALVIWGPAIINDLLLAFFLNQIFGIILALFLVKGLPFSRPVLVKRAGGKGFISLFIMFFAFLIGVCHYFLAPLEKVVWVCVPIAALINWALFNYYRKQTWESIEIGEVD